MANRPAHSKIAFALALLAAVLVSIFVHSAKAEAATMAELQADVVRCSDEYDTILKHIDELQTEMDALQARIDEIEALLPEQRQRTSDSIRWQYRISCDAPGLIELVLSADNFNDMIATIEYLDIIQARNNSELQALIDLDAELTATRTALEQDMALAEAERVAAEEALNAAIQAREELQAAILAQEAAERAERERAIEEARAHEGETFTTASGQEATVEAPPSEETGASAGVPVVVTDPTVPEDKPGNADNPEEPGTPEGGEEGENPADESGENDGEGEGSSEGEGAGEGEGGEDSGTVETEPVVTSREYYVEVWGARIDNYLAGSPLYGYGYAFAEAAWDYGVDPRWSPAISAVESSKGWYCFEPYNAWGWFAYLGSDWDSSIRAHVAGLASGYGYTLSYAAAARYCPPGDAWYAATAAQLVAVWPTDQL